MAAPTTRWLLPILVVILPYCCVSLGPPALPYNLDCFRPCDQNDCSVIKCLWSPNPPPDSSTVYSLHWEPVNTDDGQWTGGNSSQGNIARENFRSHQELRVWVQARNQHGFVKSQEVVINTEDIKKPPPPIISSNHQEPLEIHWDFTCELQLDDGTCEVRHRTEEDQDWTRYEDGLHSYYGVVNPKAGTVFEFQVRCRCHSSLMSDWSEIYRTRSAESTPIGEVDVWVDCVVPSSSFDCFLTWKNLSISQAHGHILGYDVRVVYHNGTVELINVTTVNSSSWVYDERKWYLTTSLKDVSFVSVSAYNAFSATDATHLFMPAAPGQHVNDQIIELQMNEENLTVSWEPPSLFPDDVKQYVVQYKECLPGKSFDWIKVDKNHTTVSFKGVFKKYTMYQVSLFAVSNLNEVQQLSTATGYSTQGVPSTVPSFKVFFLASTDVILFWEPVPYAKQKGVILYYQIGVVGTQKVYNVSVSPDPGNMTYKLTGLSPAQEYKVWIRAVTSAGPGSNVTTTFKTMHSEDFGYLIPILLPTMLLVITIAVIVALCVCRGTNKVLSLCLNGKVPDPRNSHIFKHMKHQINEPLTWIRIPLYEPNPKISLLEVVEIKSKVLDTDGFNRPVMENDCSQMDCRDLHMEETVTEDHNRTDRRYRREEYSKMIDSDEDRNDEFSSEEEQFISDYERHFMPNPLEILQN
ncbi:interleukin 12 receptor, beta 2a, like [Nematolebias whitei]|uniref:interleukin 12 receptor, beta 2a, like n=1 Tax=Nematolebias whitei TaxID=451745 RepID=UPI0018976306|nr:interleukin 12 receptor, beta 2a, like [Nematolebias whitei]